MKILFEGTKEQVENLKSLLKYGDNDLPTIREDYQIENLWCVEDVKSKFKCTDKEALSVLESALMNEATMEQIWLAIDFYGEKNGLELA